MRTQRDVESMLHRMYQRAGGDPSKLAHVKPLHGRWHDALSYEVTRSEGMSAEVLRKDIDDLNEAAVLMSLRALV